MKTNFDQPQIKLAIMSREYVLSRSIHALASLGIADYMSNMPISVSELAQLTGTIPEILDRILNYLSSYKLFVKSEDGYALTSLSAPLRQDHPDSIKDVLNMVDESWWQAFACLDTTLKTGIPAFNQHHGTDFFSYLNNHPEKKSRFQKGINTLSVSDNLSITHGFNFGQYKHIVDIGNGQDNLLKSITMQHQSTSITLFNLIDQFHQAKSGNYFKYLPSAEVYVLKSILHDFDDEKITNILSQLHQTIPANTSLIVAEQIIPEDEQPHTNKTMDIIMMVLVGGRQRTLENWRELIEKTGFKFHQSYPTDGIYTIIEFIKST